MTAGSAASKRLSPALVLVAGSAMVSIGAIALVVAQSSEDPPDEIAHAAAAAAARRIDVDVSTPERAAESYLDAWRKRRFDLAQTLSTGAARDQATRRMDARAQLSAEEQDLEAVWEKLAASRLTLEVKESERLREDALILRGIATGEFLGQPYEREMEFLLEHHGERWLVAQMTTGAILTDVPSVLELEHGEGDIP